MRAIEARGVTGSDRADDWWADLDDEVLGGLGDGPLSAAELGRRLGLSEEAAVALLAMLARDRKIRICRVELAA